ncbi:MAG: SGNH/GDSL hydrolase family protein [Lachnospiraceae bacterium]|nr:SGNH/GDSL hydrolase family protein [Lachnospiraceae bacterium]
MRKKVLPLIICCSLLAGCSGDNDTAQDGQVRPVPFAVPVVVPVVVPSVVTLPEPSEPAPAVPEPQEPEETYPHEVLPGYVYYHPVREDVAEMQEGDWAYRLTQQFSIWATDYLSRCPVEFSDMKIVFTGDSITAGVEADFGYPEVVRDLLQPEEVVNLGHGGSSITTIADAPMCNSYTDIPADADVIVLSGGANDSFVLTEDNFNTFADDLLAYLGNLVRHYPDAKIMFLLTMPNVTYEYLKAENDALLPQSAVRQTILNYCEGYDIEVIDLYNTLCLNPYNPMIRQEFYSDDVHPNNAGQTVLGQVVAARIAIWKQNNS